MAYTYQYPRPALTVDISIFGIEGNELYLLVIERKNDPYKGYLALPGGFVDENESVDEAAERELKEETGIIIPFLEQAKVFSKPGRDPRGHVVSCSFYGLVNKSNYNPYSGDDASEAVWLNYKDIDMLAFDHNEIVKESFYQLQTRAHFRPIGANLLGEKFRIEDLKVIYEALFQRQFDFDVFCKKIMSMDLIYEVDTINGESYYAFDENEYNFLFENGFYLKL